MIDLFIDGFMIVDSARIGLLYRVSELARRYGLRPSDANATFHFVYDGPEERPEYFELRFESFPVDPDKRDKFLRMKTALGCDGTSLIADDFSEIEDKVEVALQRAPQARIR